LVARCCLKAAKERDRDRDREEKRETETEEDAATPTTRSRRVWGGEKRERERCVIILRRW
jgi:hypothetical protein